MWSEQSFHGHRELYTRTRIRKQEPFANRHVQHAAENSKLLMHRSGLDRSQLPITNLDLDANSLTKTVTEVRLDRIGGDIPELAHAKSSFEVHYASPVRFVCFRCAHGWLGIGLQKKIRPLPVRQGLAHTSDFEEVVIPGLKSFS
jgi:hypothetical protein